MRGILRWRSCIKHERMEEPASCLTSNFGWEVCELFKRYIVYLIYAKRTQRGTLDIVVRTWLTLSYCTDLAGGKTLEICYR